MKQRIISGIVMGAIVALVLILGLNIDGIIITIFLAAIAAIATWELTFNALGIKWLPFQIIPMVYTAGSVWIISSWLSDTMVEIFRIRAYMENDSIESIEMNTVWDPFKEYAPVILMVVTAVYFITMAILSLVKQAELDLTKIFSLCVMPLFISFAFATLGSVITIQDFYNTAQNGIYYLLLILNFSSVCDMGAYFVGVSLGKTKLCPQISPKKTVEGALGGMVSSAIVGLVITLCFGLYDKILPVLLLTIPFCVAGMAGDLFASIIKRKVGIKDYGNLIPGHGGVLDRVDSILFIAPLVFSVIFIGIL
ncbi:MAG: phosphatidate cytidylyltransferase [Clostridia bacterium]|nr:phosphatidate cytidylyltransferase [Clostridia bacterium]